MTDKQSRSSIFAADLVAGVSVALILIPQGLAYAELAGMPPINGLYAAALPPLVAAAFASSPWLQTGPVALTALLTFGALSARAVPGSSDYIGQAALLALVVGVSRILIGALRAGAVTYLMSHAVLRGFTLGAALLIAASQVPAIVGADPAVSGLIARAGSALTSPGSWNLPALAFGALTVGCVVGGRWIHPLFPGLLLAVAASTALSTMTGYSGLRVGDIPAGFPEISLSLPFHELPYLVFPGMVIALVGFAEAASISQTFAEREQRPWNPNREFVSQGAANVAAALSGAFPVGGSFSRSAINHLAGARTRAAGGVTGLAVLAMLPFMALLTALPKAVLGVAIVVAIRNLMDPRPLFELWRLSPLQGAVGFVTFAMTLIFAPRVELAVVSGVAIAIAVHLWRESRQEYDVERVEHQLTIRPMGVMWFGSAPIFRRALTRYLRESPPGIRSLVIDLSGVGRLDLSAAFALRAAIEAAEVRDVRVALANVPPQLERIVERVCPGTSVIHTATLPTPLLHNPEETTMPIAPSELVARAKSEVRTIDAATAAREIKSNPKALVLDVREPYEQEEGTVPGAECVPRGLLESKIGSLCSSADQEILIYCAAGNRAALAAKTLVDMGYPRATCIDSPFAELNAAVREL